MQKHLDKKKNTSLSISHTIEKNLCTGCGICEGACPSKAISFKVVNGRFIPQINDEFCKNSKGCHRCYDACPGIGMKIKEYENELFSSDEIKEDKFVGKYINCFTGHSNDYDIRYHSASGGMITQLLIFLLEKKYIDGAVITSFDNSNELMVKSYIARTKEEIFQAKGSKYAPVVFNKVIQEIKSSTGKYVIVGMPCHIQGFRKYENMDKTFKNKIFAYFGLYCSCGRTFNLTDFVLKERNINRKELTYFAYRDEGCLGSMVARYRRGIRIINNNSETSLYNKDEVYKERYQNYYHPLRSFFIPKRCLFCIDHYARLSDISFGDIHIKPYSDDKIGINSIIIRNPNMMNFLIEAKNKGVISLDDLSVDILNKSQTMAKRKFNRIGTYMRIAKFYGNHVPVYDINLPVNNFLKYSIEYTHTRVQQFIGKHKSLWPLIKILKSKAPKD